VRSHTLRATALSLAIACCLAITAPSRAQEGGPQAEDEPIPAAPLPDDEPVPAAPLPDDEPVPPAPLDADAPIPADPAGVDARPTDAEVSELSGVTVQGTYQTGDRTLYLDERRVAANVTEALGAEQIARTGDSDVAATLKRVTGLTVVDGKYIYVRGLGERYSNVLLNGAPIPSPDYTRRVVPLDLFPTELLDGVIVQKSYGPGLPGEFGGGSVVLRTREVPTTFFFRAKGTVGVSDGTTFEDGLRYDGGGRDWTGRDDGSRRMPSGLADAISGGRFLRPQSPSNPDGATPAELQGYGRGIAAPGHGIDERSIGPDTGFSIGVGNGFELADDVRLGVIASTRYQQSWDTTYERRRTYAASNSGLNQIAALDVDTTERDVDFSFFTGLGLDIGMNHRLSLTSMLLRQSADRARISDGVSDSVESRFHEQRWTENELRADQLGGHHVMPSLHDLEFDWQYTRAKAGREEPATRRWRYDYAGDALEFSHRSDSNSTSFGDLEDDQRNLQLKAMLPFSFDDGSTLSLSAGAGRSVRDREASIRSFAFELAPGSPLPSEAGFWTLPIDRILSEDHIRPDGFVLRETTRATDNYLASQTLESGYFNFDYNFRGKLRFALGARHEKNDQEVTTFSVVNPDAPPLVASDRSSEWLPAASFTWIQNENAQWRAGFSRTLARPDFRELSRAPYTDPELDIDTIGNPDLEDTRIRNIDVRWEYYFSESDSLSIGAFDKKFENPIERLRLPGSTPLLSFANAASAHNYGVEFDAYKNLGVIGLDDYDLGFNYARIKSNVELDAESASYQTNLSRAMQGQSPYVVNLQLGYDDPADRFDANLLFNRSGRRISEVGVQGQPDVYEEAFNALDFQFRHRFAPEWNWTLRLRNLLDPEVRYTQGGLPTREFRKGREVMFSLEWRPSDS
jgi:TonB-dependent receptor